jgi:hypothetical protein
MSSASKRFSTLYHTPRNTCSSPAGCACKRALIRSKTQIGTRGFTALTCAEEKQRHSQKDEEEVEGFGTEVGFAKVICAEKEGDEDVAAACHGDNGDEGAGVAEGGEIEVIAGEEEYGYEGDLPAPEDGTRRAPEAEDEVEGDEEEGLVKGEPDLQGEGRDGAEEVTVVQPGKGAGEDGSEHEPDMGVAGKRYAFLFPRGGEEVKGEYGEEYACPLGGVEAFVEDNERSDEGEDGLGGFDGAGDGEGEILDADVSTAPRGEDEDGFEKGREMLLRGEGGYVERGVGSEASRGGEEKGREEKGGSQGDIEVEDGQDGIAVEGNLLADFITAEQDGGKEGENQPHAPAPEMVWMVPSGR